LKDETMVDVTVELKACPPLPEKPEHHIYAYALGLIRAQRRMLDRWAEGDEAVRQRLWRDLHTAGDGLAVLLPHPFAAPAVPEDMAAMIEAAFRKGHTQGFDAADYTSRTQPSHVEDAWEECRHELLAALANRQPSPVAVGDAAAEAILQKVTGLPVHSDVEMALADGDGRIWLKDAIAAINVALSRQPIPAEGEDDVAREAERMAYKTGYQEGIEDADGLFDRDACEEGWGQYLERHVVCTACGEVVDKTNAVAKFRHETPEHQERAALSRTGQGYGRGVRDAKKPRLNDAIITAAAKAHFGKDCPNIDGLDLTAHETNWTFRQGFTRMWNGAWREIARQRHAHDVEA
jgi:hypothetical protein